MGRNKFNVDEELEVGFNLSYLKRLIRYMVPYKSKIITSVIFMLISSSISLFGPVLVKLALDDYIPNVVDDNGLNLLDGKTISTIVNNELVKQLDETYRVENTYIIGGTVISRPKFLRNFESVEGNTNYLIISLVSNSILNDKEYYDLTTELKHKTKK